MKKSIVLLAALLSAPAAAVTKAELAYCELVKATARVEILQTFAGVSFDDAEERIVNKYQYEGFFKMAYRIMIDARESGITPKDHIWKQQAEDYAKDWYKQCLIWMEAE